MEEYAIKMCNKYNFDVVDDLNKQCRATGVGDLLHLVNAIKQNM